MFGVFSKRLRQKEGEFIGVTIQIRL